MSGTKTGALKGLATRIRNGDAGAAGLEEMRTAAKQGECICCGDPAVPRSADPKAARKRKRGDWQDTCGAPECKAAWFRYWRRDQRRLVSDVAVAARRMAEAMS